MSYLEGLRKTKHRQKRPKIGLERISLAVRGVIYMDVGGLNGKKLG